MPKQITLKLEDLSPLRTVDARLVSYNIEMTEVTGGTFWKEYTPSQIAGTEDFPAFTSLEDLAGLMQYYPPIDLYDAKLRALAKALGPVWVRVSGGWANDTYYDFDGHTGGKAPEGYKRVLTKEQWTGVLDFVKAVDGKLLTSMAVPGGRWVPEQAKLLFDFSRDYGVSIDAVEYINEPNALGMVVDLGESYPAVFAADHDDFTRFVHENYPGTLVVGPCAVGDDEIAPSNAPTTPTADLMAGMREPLDVFSYHYYNGSSERVAFMGGHWPAEEATTEKYLAVAGRTCQYYMPLRDQAAPGGQMWVTESGDAGGGGDTWASSYLDVVRTLNELGSFALLTDGVIFHNTLASSDYGFLKHGSFDPRPNYFAVLLWNRLMGTMVYESGIPVQEGAHVYTHSRRDGKAGIACLVINNSQTQTTTVELPKAAECYTLSADTLRSSVMNLNGKPLVLGENHDLLELTPVSVPAGRLELAPATCTFLVF